MFFAKGEIIMNNIYKVIWSKAKNCYVVASEIARSHTKSASGSEKIGGVARHALLALGAACAIACGGFVNVGAADTVDVTTGGSTATVYTKEGTEFYVAGEIRYLTEHGDVVTNKNNIITLQGKTAGLSADGKSLNSMNNVETDALKVTGQISNGTVTTTLADINESMKQTGDNKTAIDKLNEKTTDISWAAGEGTKISGVTIKDGNIVGNGNSAITQLANVGTDKINGKSLAGTTVATEKEVADAVKAETDARTEADNKLEEKINEEKTAREGKDNELEGKITKNTQDIAKLDENGVKYDTAVKDTITLKGPDSTKITNLKDADLSDSSTDAVTGKQLNKTNEDLKTEAQTRKDMDTSLSNRADALEKNTGGITRNDAKDETYIEKNVTVDNQGNITAKGTVTANGAVNAGSLTVTDASHLKGNVTMDNTLTVKGDTSLNKTDVGGALNVTGESSLKNTTVGGTLTAEKDATFEKNVTVEKDLTVTGKLNVDKISMKNDEQEATGKQHDSATTITADGITNRAKVTDENGNTTESQFTHNEKGTFNYAKDEKSTGEWKRATSNVTADGVSNTMTDSDKNTHTYYQTATESKEQLVNGDKSKSNFEKKTAEGNTISITEKDATGNPKSSLTNTQTVNGEKTSVTNKDSSSTINQGADQIRNYVASTDGTKSSTEVKADGITNTSDGTITNDANHIENKANTMDTTVTGRATESYGELDTTVKGNETHTVTGNQTNKIDKDQENIIGGSQTTTVTGKVTENYKAGQATTVTGDQDITVSGTQTTTATDINRNASSGMIDTIDNDYGTNTETKVAGKTTTDVSIKGTGEKGQYIRGANESRDYLIKGTLKNSETKTVEKTSTEITDGNGKTSATIQDVNNLAGSVTNGTETGVSGIHAKDNSVSIDSIVTDGNKYSVINQKKGSIQSTVVDGTNSTVILQDKDNVTIASSNGTVGLVGKDIVNNAQNTITNTAGTSITNQVKDSKVTTDANGTTFENNTPAVSDGGATTTKINGNHINTGRVDANELGVSDKDDQGNTADFSVKAGEGVKASASNGTTTGSLDVTGDKVESSVKDGDNETSIKQTATDITNTAKDGTIKNDAKDIVTNASNSITEKVGETNVTTKTTTSSKSEIQNADTITSVQQTENMVQSYVGKKDGSATNVTTNFANASANMVTQDGQTSTVLNNKDGLLVRNTANGKSFNTADGTNTGTALEWTNVKGNEISTGKVEANYVKMDYADVMKDLGVRGNAKVAKNLEVGETTTTKTLKVTQNATVGGTLDVTQRATFHDDVDIANNLSVGKAVTAKSYKVGEKTYIDENGIHANGQKITDVADGSISEGSKDAVNGGQLYNVKNDLEGKVNKVGANAAAMANLHPMEFDPDSKWNIAAAIGNYGSETAAALGAFYRPNDDVMVNLSTAFGTGENMVGGGVSVRLGKGGNKLSREETNALKAQVDDLTARMDALLSVLNPNMSKDFPDVPENHWAYEAVSRLAGNDIVQGYPDGEFHGERTMTRYEMAEIIYNALSRGAEAEKELVEEFKPELQAMAASEKATAERAEG